MELVHKKRNINLKTKRGTAQMSEEWKQFIVSVIWSTVEPSVQNIEYKRKDRHKSTNIVDVCQ